MSLLTQPLERYDIERQDTVGEDIRRRGRHQRPLPWRFAELPQAVIRVGYAAVKAPAAQHRTPEIRDLRTQPPPGCEADGGLPG